MKNRSDGELLEQYYPPYGDVFVPLSARTIRPQPRTHCGIYPVAVPNVLEAVDYAVLAWREAKKKLVPGAVLFDHAMLETAAMFQAGEQEVNLALQEGRFLFYLQPKVDLYSGEIVGAEALARRWCAGWQYCLSGRLPFHYGGKRNGGGLGLDHPAQGLRPFGGQAEAGASGGADLGESVPLGTFAFREPLSGCMIWPRSMVFLLSCWSLS